MTAVRSGVGDKALSEKDAGAGRPELDPAELPTTMTLIEAGCLEAAGFDDGSLAATPYRFVLDRCEQPTALRLTTDMFGKKEHIDKQEAKLSTPP